jgi:hypothetical protein
MNKEKKKEEQFQQTGEKFLLHRVIVSYFNFSFTIPFTFLSLECSVNVEDRQKQKKPNQSPR